MYANILNMRLLFQTELHDAVVKHRSRLKWAADAEKVDDSSYEWLILKTILVYDEKYGRLPSRKALIEFVQTTDDFFVSRQAEWFEPEIRALKENVDDGLLKQFTDPEVLITETIKEARVSSSTHTSQLGIAV
jgi:hypothetical protein